MKLEEQMPSSEMRSLKCGDFNLNESRPPAEPGSEKRYCLSDLCSEQIMDSINLWEKCGKLLLWNMEDEQLSSVIWIHVFNPRARKFLSASSQRLEPTTVCNSFPFCSVCLFTSEISAVLMVCLISHDCYTTRADSLSHTFFSNKQTKNK